jgi:light-regulated signal transduction histidine kinase (bacteriophytochrome)
VLGFFWHLQALCTLVYLIIDTFDFQSQFEAERVIQKLFKQQGAGDSQVVVSRFQSGMPLFDALRSNEHSGALVTYDPLPAVLADETQLIQLFQNIIGNTIKYQNPGVPHIHISAAKCGANRWTFSVKDNGIGIDSQHFERIFRMFQRLHKREEFDGTGVGLAICKKIVERHGGGISVESQPGQGSTFRFSLTEADTN